MYPQIYASDVKLLIDPAAVRVTRQDFVTAMQGVCWLDVRLKMRTPGGTRFLVACPRRTYFYTFTQREARSRLLCQTCVCLCVGAPRLYHCAVCMHADLTPAAHRATASHAKALNPVIQPCLQQALDTALTQVKQICPPAVDCMAASAASGHAGASAAGSRGVVTKMGSSRGGNGGGGRHLLQVARPRMLLVGPPGSGQQQLGAAVLAALEGLPVHCIGLTSLLANVAAR